MSGCPGEVALATFDDLPFAYSFHPRLTAVAQPGNTIGYQGANLLIDRVEGKLKAAPQTVRLAPELSEIGSQPNISAILAGRRPIGKRTALKLAERLQVSLDLFR